MKCEQFFNGRIKDIEKKVYVVRCSFFGITIYVEWKEKVFIDAISLEVNECTLNMYTIGTGICTACIGILSL